MKLWIGICLSILSICFVLGVAVYPYAYPVAGLKLVIAAYLLEPIFMVQPLGAVWMLYQVVRYESKLLGFILLALFVPFSFVWYYFDRTRPRSRNRKRALVVGSN